MLSCAITGHRPNRFKFKYQENNTGCKRLKKRLHDQFILLYERGVRRYFVGAALGVDMWSGEILLRLKEQPAYSDIELIVVIPFDGHDSTWDERSKSRLAYLLQHCTESVTVSSHSSPEAYKARNYYMVDHADILLAVYDNDRSIRSGTGQTVNYARKRNLPLIFIHPDTGIVNCSMDASS